MFSFRWGCHRNSISWITPNIIPDNQEPALVRSCLAEIGVGVQQWSAAGSQGRMEDRVRSVVSGHAVLGLGEPAIHLRCPRFCRWWIYKRPADEEIGLGGSVVI